MGKKKSSCLGQLLKATLWFCFWPIGVVVLLYKHSKKKKNKMVGATRNNIVGTSNQSPGFSQRLSNDTLSELNNALSEPLVQFRTTISTSHSENSVSDGHFSWIDFGKPEGDPERFMNYSYYEVSGNNESGKSTFKIVCGTSEEDAIYKAKREGLMPPYTTKKTPAKPATERQIDCLRKNNISFPDEINKDIAHDILSRFFGDDSEEGPEPWLIDLAVRLNKSFTSYIGHDGLLQSVLLYSDTRTCAALYAYGVNQNMRGLPFGNMFLERDVEKFYRFADNVIANESLVKSLQGRNTYDFLKPNKNTNIYKAAHTFLINN